MISTNATLPLLFKNPKILLVGAGNVALQKARTLQENGIDFSIIAENISPEIQQTTKKIKQKRFQKKDIGDFFIIINATGIQKVTKKLLKHKKKHPLLLNIVNAPDLCDFYFMALTPNRPLQIAVSSNGASPTAAKFFRDECEKIIPKDIDKYLRKKKRQRERGIIQKEQTHQELKNKKK